MMLMTTALLDITFLIQAYLHLFAFFSILQDVNVNSFTVCLKDIQPYDGYHDPITVDYMAVGCKYQLLILLNASGTQNIASNFAQ